MNALIIDYCIKCGISKKQANEIAEKIGDAEQYDALSHEEMVERFKRIIAETAPKWWQFWK